MAKSAPVDKMKACPGSLGLAALPQQESHNTARPATAKAGVVRKMRPPPSFTASA
jgi:hypothetical protein